MNELSRDDWLTVPNAITVARMVLLAPICFFLITDQAAVLPAVLLMVFGMTDWIDGYVARRFNQVSRVGAVLDPIADRLGVAVIASVLVIAGYLPHWVAYCIVLTDLALVLFYLFSKTRYRPPVNLLGKLRTAVLMLGLPLTVFGRIPGLDLVPVIGVVTVAIGAILHVLTGGVYAWEMHNASRDNGSRPSARTAHETEQT